MSMGGGAIFFELIEKKNPVCQSLTQSALAFSHLGFWSTVEYKELDKGKLIDSAPKELKNVTRPSQLMPNLW